MKRAPQPVPRIARKKVLAPLPTEELFILYREKKAAIQKRLGEFANVPNEEYFYECVYCVLTPQSSAVNAGRAVEVLRRNDLWGSMIDPEPLLHQAEYYIRFHKTKTKNLLQLKERFAELAELLGSDQPGEELRAWIVKNVRGMGWKEASHFLRNIGYRELAILDRHILKNLVRVGALKALPKTLTPKTYLAIEQQFKDFAREIGIPMDELDLLFWSMETGEILK